MQSSQKKVHHDAIAGSVAGGFSRLFTAPFDLVKIRLQTQQPLERGRKAKRVLLIPLLRDLYREEGLRGLWRGNLAATYLWVTYAGLQFGVYGVIDEAWKNAVLLERTKLDRTSHHEGVVVAVISSPTLREFTAGAVAGVVSTAATYPLDYLRTIFAAQGTPKVFSSLLQCCKATVNHRGVSGLYMGASPAIVSIVPYMGLNFALYERFKRALEASAATAGNVPSKITSPATSSTLSITVVNSLPSWLLSGASGALAGGIAKFLTYPLDTVKKRMQVQLLHETKQAAPCHTNPIIGLTAPSPSMGACGLTATPVFIIHDITASHPRSSSMKVPDYYRSWLHCICRISREEGVASLYRGLLPTGLKSVVSTGVTFATFRFVQELLASTATGSERTGGARP